MRLFVDDTRSPPPGWLLATTLSAAQALLLDAFDGIRTIEALSLDHDLGGDEDTRPLVLWMCQNEWWPPKIVIHTANISAREWLEGMVSRYAPEGTLQSSW